jgi:hypothetical protein
MRRIENEQAKISQIPSESRFKKELKNARSLYVLIDVSHDWRYIVSRQPGDRPRQMGEPK